MTSVSNARSAVDRPSHLVTALVLMPVKDQNYDTVMRCANNIENAKVLLASYLNVRDVLNFEKVVLPVKTIDALVAHFG